MLKKEIKKLLDQIITSASREELIWINGYFSGILSGQGSTTDSDAHKLVENVTVIYATDTGNSKYISGEIAKKLKEKSVNVKVKASNQYRLKDLEKEQYIIFIISTHGDGEVPESGKKLYDYLHNNDLNLSSLNYFVIALGDTNYPLFCQAGRDFDNRLEELKAKRLSSRVDLDLDFENHLEDIYQQIINMLSTGKSSVSASGAIKAAKKSSQHHYSGEIISNIDLNDIGSSRQTNHIEITCEEQIDYAPGDAVGIILEEDDPHLKELFPNVKGKIAPRLYSIASSFNEHEGEVHLTVSVLKYKDENGDQHQGICSNYLASLKEGQKVKFYISKNRRFKLPEDNNKDIIMVGPGTGIAPFRAFLAERNYNGAKGKNWLFFGERNFQTDFLYQTEWLDYLDSGLLTKFDVAFSRDQKQKIYIQNRMAENAEQLYSWLENGAYFYICGDKEKMAKDVENCLLNIIEKQGNKTAERAREYLADLEEQGKYLKDVY